MLIDVHHRATRGQSEHQSRFFAHRAGDELRCLPADFFTVALQKYQHAAPSLYLAILLAEAGYGGNRESSILPEPADDEIVPVPAVKPQYVHDRFSLRRIDPLANTQQRIAARHAQELGNPGICGRGVYLFIRIAKHYFIIALKNPKQ